jgi:hypothetical protein
MRHFSLLRVIKTLAPIECHFRAAEHSAAQFHRGSDDRSMWARISDSRISRRIPQKAEAIVRWGLSLRLL